MNVSTIVPSCVCLALATMLSTGCSKHAELAEPAPPSAPSTPAQTKPSAQNGTAEEPQGNVQKALADVFFDYDSSQLTARAQSVLDRNGRELTTNTSSSLTIEGHCDERGTVEYNLSLGDRRARSAKDYLVRYGISPGRIAVISYGEERPFAVGSDEAAYAQNRRAHFVAR